MLRAWKQSGGAKARREEGVYAKGMLLHPGVQVSSEDPRLPHAPAEE